MQEEANKNEKEESQEERQARITAEARAFAFSGLTASDVRRGSIVTTANKHALPPPKAASKKKPTPDASPVPVVFDEGEASPKKKRKLSAPLDATTTDDGTGADPCCSDEVSILSPEDKAMMQKIRRIAREGYYEGLIALKFGRSRPTTKLVDWNSITTIAEEILYNNEPSVSGTTRSRTTTKRRAVTNSSHTRNTASALPRQHGLQRSVFKPVRSPHRPRPSAGSALPAATDPSGCTAPYSRIRSVTPPPPTTQTRTTTTTTPTRQSHSPQRADEITVIRHDLPTLAILKHEMSDLRYTYSKKKPKEGGWAHSIAAKNIDNWVKDTSGGIDDLSVHQLMIFLQAHSYAQLDLHKSFLQKCNLQQFFVDMDAKEITSDLKTIKACLKLIQDANSDTTKIAEQITILEDVSIVQSMIKVS